MIKNPKPKSEIKRIERYMQQNPPKFLQKMKNPSNETANDKNIPNPHQKSRESSNSINKKKTTEISSKYRFAKALRVATTIDNIINKIETKDN